MVTEIVNFADPINHYFNQVLSREEIKVKFGPTQQYADMVRTSSSPVIIYSWVLNGITEDWFTRDDLLVYTLFSQDDDVIRKVVNLIVTNFKDYELAAERVNKFVDQSSVQEFKKFDYDYISFYSASGIEPASEENGRASITVTLRAGYREI